MRRIMPCLWFDGRAEEAMNSIVPAVLGNMLQDKDAKKAGRVMETMMKMVKLDVQLLREAYEREI